MDRTVNLRSDTFTRPNEEMRRVMAAAEVGDDVYGEDPTVNRLQEMCAKLFGREAALFVPSGCMGNAICLSVLTSPGSEVICDRLSHIYGHELGSMAALSGAVPRVVDGPAGVPSPEQIEANINPDIYYMSKTTCVSIENTANVAGGRVCSRARIEAILAVAASHGLSTHLDGARIFNAVVALGTSVDKLTAGIDAIMFCVSKGLGAPIGSLVLGNCKFIREAWRVRKLFGGGMRQVGILAAACIYALENNVERLAEDHANARRLAEQLAVMPGLSVTPGEVESNIVMIHLDGRTLTAQELSDNLRQKGVLADPIERNTLRLVTSLEVNSDDISYTLEQFEKIFSK